jgi:hypothetical protein
MLQGAPYDLIIIDESHLIRRFDAARTRSILAPAPTAAAITPSSMDPPGAWTWSSRLWCLTGTPIVNSAADLWPLAYGPMRMPVSWWDWGNQFCDEMRQDGFGGIRPIGLKNIPALADTMRPHVLRRTLPGIGIILPPLTINQVPVPVDQAALARAMADLEGWTPARLALALELRDELHDAALARVRKVLGLAKVQVVARHVDQMLKNGEGPVVVFFQHTQVREELFTELSTRCGYKVSWIDGKVSRAQVTAAEDWFSMGWLDVILVQTDAGGVGISLVRSNRCVIAELPWTSVAMFQGVARLHRIRQERPVLAEVIRAHGCWLEEALAGAVSKKQRAAEQFLTALETFS